MLKLLVFFCLFSSSAFASIKVNLDYKDNELGDEIVLKEEFETHLGETTTFNIPNKNQVIELKVTDNIPDILVETGRTENQVMVDMKVYKEFKGERVLISAPKIISVFGQEASMQTYEDKEMKKPVMSLKVTPRKL